MGIDLGVAASGKYDGALVMPDGKIVTQQGELKNVLYYHGDLLWDSPVIYVHPDVFDPDSGQFERRGDVLVMSSRRSLRGGIYRLTGQHHPQWPAYLHAVWPD